MKRNLLYYFAVFLLSSLCTQSSAQTVEDSLLERIAYYQEVDSFELFFQTLKKLSRHYKSYDDRFYKVIDSFEKFTPYRKAKSKEESILIRGYYASLIYALKKTNDNPSFVLKTALVAHEYVHDKNYLDKYAWYIENDIGHIYAKLDDYDSSLYFYKLVERSLRETNKYEFYSRSYLNIGRVYLWKKDTIKAKKQFQISLKIARKYSEPIAITAAFEKLCSFSLDTDDLESYKSYKLQFQKHLLLTPNDPDKDKRLRMLLEMEANYNYQSGINDNALILFDSLINVYKNDKLLKLERSLPKLFLKKAVLLKNLRQYKESLVELKNAKSWFKNHITDNTLVDINLQEARIYREIYSTNNDSLFKSIKHYKKALDLNEILNEHFIYSQSSVLSTEKSREIIEEALEILYDEKLQLARFEKVVHLTRLFFDKSKNRLTDKKEKINSKILDLDNDSRQIVDSLTQVLVSTYSVSSKNMDSINEIVFRIKNKINGEVGLFEDSSKTRISDDYFEFVYGKEYCFVLSHIEGEFDMIKINRTDIDSLQNSINTILLSKSREQEIFKIGSEFAKVLGLEKKKLNDRIVFIPDCPLFVFPFDLLVYRSKYLLYTTSVSIQSSIYKKLHKDEYKEPSLIIHAPKYPDAIPGIQEHTRSSIYKLPYVKSEISGVDRSFKNTKIIEFLTDEILSNSLEGASIYHFAGHAKAFKDSAYLYLSKDSYRDKLTFNQIQNQSLDLELVTLSACETGLGEFVYGDGLNSLARAFQAAGAKSVLSSLWTVNDRSTSEIMQNFYSRLKNGDSKDRALRNSKLEYIKNANPQFQHPYYWSGFALQGNTNKITASSSVFWIFGFLLILIIIIKFIK